MARKAPVPIFLFARVLTVIFELESTLSGFRASETSWDDARHILEQQTDSHMQYFALSIYEEWIATKWALVPDARKSELLYFLFDLAVQPNKVCSTFCGSEVA